VPISLKQAELCETTRFCDKDLIQITSIHGRRFTKTANKSFLWFCLLIWAGVCFFNALNIEASETKISAATDLELNSEDKLLVDQFLDKVMGISHDSIPELQAETSSIPTTAYGFSLNLESGHEKNVLNSSWLNLSSNKLFTAVDFFYSRKRSRINELSFYVYLNNSHYPDLDTDGDKQGFFTRGGGKSWISETNALGIDLSYFKQLSFDANNIVENQPIPMYRNEEMIVTPTWEKDFGDGYLLGAKLEALSKRTQEPADDFDRQKIIAYLKIGYGRRSENRITYESDRSLYKDAENLDLEGYIIDDTKLEIESGSIGLINNHHWSGQNRVSLFSKLVYLAQEDNGPGYYNYNYAYWGETIRVQLAGWQFSSSFSYSIYQYEERRVYTTDTNSEPLYHSYLNLRCGVKRDFGDDLTFKIDTTSLISKSNDLLDQTSSDSIMFGVIYFL
jgi:hypothetical protein